MNRFEVGMPILKQAEVFEELSAAATGVYQSSADPAEREQLDRIARCAEARAIGCLVEYGNAQAAVWGIPKNER